MMNINSAIFVPQGVPPPMPHMLTFMPPPPPPPTTPAALPLPNIQCMLQHIHHEQQQKHRQHIMYQQYLQQQQHIQQQMFIKQQQLKQKQQQQQQQQQKLLLKQNYNNNRGTHRMQEIQQIHQQQRFQQCVQNKLIMQRRYKPICFEEWSNISLMRLHQTQQLAEEKPDIADEKIVQIFSTETEYETFLYDKERKYRLAEEQLQNEQNLLFLKYFPSRMQNATKRQPMLAKFDNKKVKMQQNVATQCDNLVSCHNSEVHRNSTSSEITFSDDLNSCSSNDDLEMQKKSNKSARHANNRQNKRQSKRKQNNANKQQNANMQQQQQQQQQQPPNNQQQQQPKLTIQQQQQQQNNMDVDDMEEGKENKIPTVMNNNNNNNNNNNANKGRHATNNKRAKNTRISVQSKEQSLVKANSNSTVSIHSSNSSDSTNSSPSASPAAQKRSVDNIKKIVRALVPNYMAESMMSGLQITETQFYMALQRHMVPNNLLRVYGYPVESVFHEGCVEIFKLMPRGNFNNIRGIVNMCDDLLTKRANTLNDSGKGSSDNSPPDLDCEINEDENIQPITGFQQDDSYQIFSQYDQSLKKKCVRCKASFHVTEGGQYVTREECVFHWGKKYQLYDARQKMMDVYSCCNKELTAVGCSRNKLHVWNGAVMGINGPYTDFVYTYDHYNEDGTVRRSNKVFALDCEMSYTAHGLDLTKVTVINADGNIVYEKFVIPAAEIADYNTRFSGITKKDLCPKSNIALKTLPEVQRDLLEIISADSIIIGHGLDNDLRALRMVHKTIVDTSITYPHRSGFPYRLSLKHLARSYLGRNIQASGLGHSSLEDSLAALHLMYVKVQSDQYRANVSE